MDEIIWNENIQKTREIFKKMDNLLCYIQQQGVDFSMVNDLNSFRKCVVDAINIISDKWGFTDPQKKKALLAVLPRGESMAYYYLKKPEIHILPRVPFGYFEKLLEPRFGENLNEKEIEMAQTGELLLYALTYYCSIKCEQIDAMMVAIGRDHKSSVIAHQSDTDKAKSTDQSKLLYTPLWVLFEPMVTDARAKKYYKIENCAIHTWFNREKLFECDLQDFNCFINLVSLSDKALDQVENYNIFRLNQRDDLQEIQKELSKERIWLEGYTAQGLPAILADMSRMTVVEARNERYTKLISTIFRYRFTFRAFEIFMVYMNVFDQEQKTALSRHILILADEKENRRLHRIAEQNVDKVGIELATKISEEFFRKQP